MSVEYVDSNLSRGDALDGSGIQDPALRAFHEKMKRHLEVIDVCTKGFEGETRRGQLVAHTALADTIGRIFDGLHQLGFPIGQVIPVGNEDGWLDEKAMQANKTTAYAPRLIPGSTKLSEHAKGLAVDINPILNPCVHPDGTIEPHGAIYLPEVRGTISPHSKLGEEVIALFAENGFEWGGHWRIPPEELPEKYRHHSAQPHLPDAPADYQHFQPDNYHIGGPFDLPDNYQ